MVSNGGRITHDWVKESSIECRCQGDQGDVTVGSSVSPKRAQGKSQSPVVVKREVSQVKSETVKGDVRKVKRGHERSGGSSRRHYRRR